MANANLKNQMFILNIIYFAFLMGPLVLAGVIFMINEGSMAGPGGFETPLEIVGLVMLVGCFSASIFIFQHLMTKAAKERDLETKMEKARAAYIIRWAFLEGVSLLLLVFLLLTENTLFLMLYGIAVVMYLSARITPNRLRKLLKLSRSEMQELGY